MLSPQVDQTRQKWIHILKLFSRENTLKSNLQTQSRHKYKYKVKTQLDQITSKSRISCVIIVKVRTHV